MATLPNNSYIRIDGTQINGNGLLVGVWETVLARAMAAGETRWLRLNTDDGMVSVLVTPTTKVTSFVSWADAGGAAPGKIPQTNIAVWIEDHIPRESEDWGHVEMLGLDKEVDALDD